MGEARLVGVAWVDLGRGQWSARPARRFLDPLGVQQSVLRRQRSPAVVFAVMSTAMNFGTKSFQPRPPDKGSFPLDHFGEARLGSGC